MAKSFRYLVPALLASMLVLSLRGQTDPAAQVNLRFNVFSVNALSDVAYHAAAEAPLATLQFFNTTRSPEYSYKGNAVVKFFDPNVPKGPPVAIWETAAGIHNAFVLFFPKSGPSPDGIRYTTYAVDDSLDKIPIKHFAILNVSGREYVGRVGSRTFPVPVGYNAPIEGSGRVYLELLSETNGNQMVIGGHQFDITGNERAMVVIFPPARKSSIQPLIRSLTDAPVIAEKPAKRAKASK